MTWMFLLKWKISIKDTQSWINSVFFKRLKLFGQKKVNVVNLSLGLHPK